MHIPHAVPPTAPMLPATDKWPNDKWPSDKWPTDKWPNDKWPIG